MRIVFVGDSLTSGIPGSSFYAILRVKLTGHTLVNLGEGNDTAVSLYRRLSRLHLERFDVAFLWVGVNDVASGAPRSFQVINLLLNKPRSKSLNDFRTHYRATLDLLLRHARRVIAVSPLLKGEDTGNPGNRELEVLARAIEDLTSQYERVEYLDLRAVFVQRLAGKSVSDYMPTSPVRVVLDALTLRSNEQIDRKATERGLHLTLDGIHLNSVGAELAAEGFLKAIAGGLQKP